MIYLLQSVLYSGILYAIYAIALRDRATHAWNRFYLLLCASVPFLLPFIVLPGVQANSPIAKMAASISLQEITVLPGGNSNVFAELTATEILASAYVLISIVLLIRLCFQYVSFRRFTSGMKYELIRGNVKVIKFSNYGPGSFGNYIFFPGENIDPKILQHELAHVLYRHTTDIVIMKLLRCFFWPNFMLYVIDKELRVVHEFQADIHSAGSKEEYMRSLLNDIFATNRFSLSHTFFHHPIKRRIVMLQKTPQSRNTLRTVTIRSGISAALLMAGVIYLQSCKPQPDASAGPSVTKQVTEAPPAANQTSEALYEADVMPESSVDINKFISENVTYPAAAKKNKIEGKVIVRFIVDAEGVVTSPTILKSPDETMSAEAIRVIKLIPKWKPGVKDGKNVAVYFNIPISFKLS